MKKKNFTRKTISLFLNGNYLVLLCFLLGGFLFSTPSFAQDISLILDNEENTTDGVDDYYEADVLARSDAGFALGSGQIYINYNTAAFGTNVDLNGGLEITFPGADGYVIGTLLPQFGDFPFYQDFIINDNDDFRFSFSWQQSTFSSGCLGGNNISATPVLLFHVKIKYTNPGESPDVCFESEDLDIEQFFMACGPADFCVPKSCPADPNENKITGNYTFVSGPTWYADTDGDGFGDPNTTIRTCDEQPAGFVADNTDCDDTNGAVNPGATEICDGIDNDCDGLVDSDDPSLDLQTTPTWYADTDGDGFGDPNSTTEACSQPAGFVADDTDCDDTNADINPGAQEICDGIDNDCDGLVDDDDDSISGQPTWYADTDGDGFGDANNSTEACNQPTGFVADDTDCDDANADINPGAPEICDGIDNDCDGSVDDDDDSITGQPTWYADTDGDGFGDPNNSVLSCNQPSGFVADDTDCDDTNADINPAAQEICDGIDNDCDGLTDADDPSVTGTATWYADTDGDGFGDANNSTEACNQPSGFVADDTDCDDTNADINPGAPEICDGIDNDCDGLVDDDDDSISGQPTWYADTDGDSFGDANNSVLSCNQPSGFVADNTDCDDTNAAINPGAQEICDGIDNDCDGLIDDNDPSISGQPTWYADTDGDGFGDPNNSVLSCNQPSGFVADNTDCDDTDGAVNPGAQEICDGIDNDCDGLIDADDPSVTGTATWYADTDGDGFGDANNSTEACNQPSGFVADDTDCDDTNADINPGAPEICDGIDNDCDGLVDDDDDSISGQPTWYADTDGDGFGDANNSVLSCNQPSGFVADDTDCDDTNAAINPGAQEICDGIDNDCDGLIDDNDPSISGQPTWYADTDGDGFGDPNNATLSCNQPAGFVADNTDCDDTNGAVNPNAQEICDGIDNDCDGLVDGDDPSAIGARTWYADTDGDSYGDPNNTTEACDQPAGFVADDTDCDDTNADINPGAQEICDGIDNDCDGLVDDADDSITGQPTWYADTDGDGFGDPNNTTLSCNQPAGFVADNTDCDDTDASTYPNAPEICDDGIDNDCDGIVDNCCTAEAGEIDGPAEICGGLDATFTVSDANTEDGFNYFWVVTTGAPDYTVTMIVTTDENFSADIPADAIEGGCVHGLSFEGTYEDLIGYITANNITTGVEVLEAINNFEICADLIVQECIEVDVKRPLLETAACNDMVIVSTEESCEVLFTADMGLEGNFECYNQLEVTIVDNDGNSWSELGAVDIPSGYAGQTLIFKVGDPRNDNHCWGRVKVEDKTPPTITCPDPINEIDGVELLCDDINDADVLAAIPGPEYDDNCGNATLSGPVDVIEEFDPCGGEEDIVYKLTRTWTVTDQAGFSASCEQIVTFERPSLSENDELQERDDVEYPTKEVDVSCDFVAGLLAADEDLTEADLLDENGHPTPLALELLGYDGYPSVTSASGEHWLDESYCNIGASYDDISVIEVCENTIKIVRQWIIIDWCADTDDQDALNNSTVVNHRQIIKFGDFTEPTITAPEGPITVSANAFSCEGTVTVPAVTVSDNCAADEDLTITATLYKKEVVDVLGRYGQVIGQTEDYVEVGSGGVGESYGGIELGVDYKIVYTVTDLCNNTSESVEVAVNSEDDNEPVAVCDDDLHISIGGDGLARITDEDVDEGSWDNCGEVETWVSRKLASDALVDAYLAKVHDGAGYLLSGYDDKDKSSDAEVYVKDTNGNGTIDDGEDEKILRKKDGMWYTWWEKEIYFLCDDIAERVTIELLAEDEQGLTNVCWNDVLIEDKISAYCEAPDDIVWDCTELPYGFDPQDDAQLAELFGNATATDNCPDATADQIDKTVDWDCNSGTITRTFQAADARGLTSTNTCTQTIVINPVHNYEITFPADPAPVVCGDAVLDDLVTNIIGCDLLTVNVVNDTFSASGDACYKIKRTFSVINWCEYDGDSPAVQVSRDADCDGTTGEEDVYVLRRPTVTYIDRDNDENNDPSTSPCGNGAVGHYDNSDLNYDLTSTGYWTYVQYVKVVDDFAPEVTIGGDDVFCSLDNAGCDAEVTIPITVTDTCAGPDLEVKALVDGEAVEVDGDYPNYSITGEYGIGEHELEIHAVDGCRNSALATKTFTVEDCKAPTPICINGLAIELMPTEDGGGMMEIWASDFEVNSLDAEDCSGILDLSINLLDSTVIQDQKGLTFTCEEAGDTVAVEIHSWDGAGNNDFCVTYVVVQDNMFDLCTDPGKVEVAGLIANENNETVEKVQVSLTGMMSNDMLTSVDGNYTFNGLTNGGDYTVTPWKDDDYLNGVSTFDLVLITKHILGTKKLEGPYKRIAADANNSGSISALDLIQFRKLILSVSVDLPSNTSWRFIPTDYQFPDANNPWAQSFPEILNYNDLQQAIISGDFVAVKIGDVNENAKANSLLSDQRSIAGVFNLNVEDQTLVAGNEYRIAFTAEDLSVQGYQFTLNYDKMELMDIEYGVATAEHFGVIEDGVITTSWNGEASSNELFTLVVRAHADGQLSEMLSVNSRYTRAEAYNTADELMDVALTFNGEAIAEGTYELYQNVPNPFQGETMISFRLPVATQATITIQDVTGKTLKVIRGEYVSGFNQIRVNSSELPSTGVLYYTLATDKFTASKKMVVISE